MSQRVRKICWSVTLFLILNPIISVLALALYLVFSTGYTATELIEIGLFAGIFAILTNLSITMGYHRLWAHKSFEAHPWLERILLAISASAFQGSALKWASDHRIHHRFEDTDKDPYSIRRGFWHAHMGWMMKHETVSLPINAPDLEKNKWIKNQHDYYILWSILTGYAFPALVGYWLGNAFLGLVIGGGLRIFLTQQSTFLVNSLSHTLGKTSYSSIKTAKDSLIVAILTHGEGYHNFHHQFQTDYRNGIRWYHWDPTKWSIQIAYVLGLARKLRKVKFSEILKARMQVEAEKFYNSKFFDEQLAPLKDRIIQTQVHFEQLQAKFESLKSDYNTYHSAQRVRVEQLRAEMKLAQIELKANLAKWRLLMDRAQVLSSQNFIGA